jgi:uncharacterized protein DUF4231
MSSTPIEAINPAPTGRITGPGATGDLTLDRLEWQADWYEKNANRSRLSFQTLKVIQILAAALVPVMATLSYPAWITASLGGSVVLVEGIQGAFKFHDNWIGYRNAHEALIREKYLFLAHADAYAMAPDPHRLLAEHVEAVSGEEHAGWLQAQQQPPRQGTEAKSE